MIIEIVDNRKPMDSQNDNGKKIFAAWSLVSQHFRHLRAGISQLIFCGLLWRRMWNTVYKWIEMTL